MPERSVQYTRRERPIYSALFGGPQLSFYTATKPHNKCGGHVPRGSERPSCSAEEERERQIRRLTATNQTHHQRQPSSTYWWTHTQLKPWTHGMTASPPAPGPRQTTTNHKGTANRQPSGPGGATAFTQQQLQQHDNSHPWDMVSCLHTIGHLATTV